jgi:hypothetical protein
MPRERHHPATCRSSRERRIPKERASSMLARRSMARSHRARGRLC